LRTVLFGFLTLCIISSAKGENVTLSGTITAEDIPQERAAFESGPCALILRTENGKEIRLFFVALAQPSIPKRQLGKARFLVTGSLGHSPTLHHTRPIFMMVKRIDVPR
jgi:hypothetical protein